MLKTRASVRWSCDETRRTREGAYVRCIDRGAEWSERFRKKDAAPFRQACLRVVVPTGKGSRRFDAESS